MTLPFVCEDCGGTITLTTDEALAIYQSRIALCQRCIDSMEEEAEAYDEVMREGGRECVWDAERGALVLRRLESDTRPMRGAEGSE